MVVRLAPRAIGSSVALGLRADGVAAVCLHFDNARCDGSTRNHGLRDQRREASVQFRAEPNLKHGLIQMRLDARLDARLLDRGRAGQHALHSTGRSRTLQ